MGSYFIKDVRQIFSLEIFISFYDVLLWTLHIDALVLADYQVLFILCVDIRCRLDDLQEAIEDRDWWQEKERERESGEEGNPCYHHDLMMRMLMKIIMLPLSIVLTKETNRRLYSTPFVARHDKLPVEHRIYCFTFAEM